MDFAEQSPVVWIACALALGIGLRLALDALRGPSRRAMQPAPPLAPGDLVILVGGEEARAIAIGRRFIRLARASGGELELPRRRAADELVAVFRPGGRESALVVPIAASLADLPRLREALAPIEPPPRLSLVGEGARRALRIDLEIGVDEIERRRQLREQITRRLADAIEPR